MAFKENKKRIRVCMVGQSDPFVYTGVDDTGVIDGVFYHLYWRSPGKTINLPIENILWISEEHESENKP